MKKVLIIDDDLSCLEVMELLVSDLGCKTYTYSSWKSQTIQQIIEIFPDVIILDEYLTGVRGSEICVILKSINQLRTVPIILVSGSDELPEIARKSRADSFIEKPFGIDYFSEKVSGCLYA